MYIRIVVYDDKGNVIQKRIIEDGVFNATYFTELENGGSVSERLKSNEDS